VNGRSKLVNGDVHTSKSIYKMWWTKWKK